MLVCWMTNSMAAMHRAVPLIIYAAVGYDQSVVRAFEQRTHISVKLVTMSTGPLLARVTAEAKNPQWDMIWFDGAEAIQHLADQGLLVRYVPQVRWTKMGRLLQPANHHYVVTAATLAGVLVINTQKLPKSQWPWRWNMLFNPRYHHKVGMNNPAISGPTYPFVAGILKWQGSVDAGKKWFDKLKSNGLRVYAKNAVTLRALQFGEIDVAIVQDTAGLGRSLSGLPFQVIYPSPVTLLPRVIGISKSSSMEAQQEAKRFIRFLLSAKGQKAAKQGDPLGDSNYYPLIEGVSPRKSVPSLSKVSVQRVRPSVWGKKEPHLVEWFENRIVH